MRDPNPRVRPPREKFELSLDGKQVASTVVGALVLLAVVFVLGMNVGKQLALRHAERPPAGDLEALDRVPGPPAPVKDESLTFHDRLTKDAPAQLPPVPERQEPPAPSPTATPTTTATPTATPNPTPKNGGASSFARPVPSKPWTVQLAAAQDRGEAERVATRFSGLSPRIEEANVPGKGRFWRVRVGAFDTRDGAERYLRDVARETGAKGFVTPTR
jgi:DedD protein